MMSPVYVQDVAQAFVAALADSRSIGRIYTLGGPDDLSWTELIRRVAKTVSRDKWVVPCPIGMIKFVATLFAWQSFFPVTPDQLTMLAEGNTVDTDDVAELIGQAPREFSVENLSYLANDAVSSASSSVPTEFSR